MKEKLTTVKKTNRLIGKTDWERLKKMSERDIMLAAKSDPDNPPLTAKDLQQFKRVNPKKSVDVKKIRKIFNFSQAEFAVYFGISKRTLQQWEQHRSKPSTLAANFLRVIEKCPEAVQQALG